MNDIDLRLSGTERTPTGAAFPPIGQVLVDTGKIAADDLKHALALQKRIDARLGDIMISEGLVDKQDLLGALAIQAQTQGADLNLNPPAATMVYELPAWLCLRYGVVPWRSDEQGLHVATSSPGDFAKLRRAVGTKAHRMHPVIVDEGQIRAQQSRLYGPELAENASTRVPATESCRHWHGRTLQRMRWAGAILAVLAGAALLWPVWTLTALVICAMITLTMTTALKAAALCAHLTRRVPAGFFAPVAALAHKFSSSRPQPRPDGLAEVPAGRAAAALRIAGAIGAFQGGMQTINADETRFRMPRVSVLVPLLREREIAGQLIERLSCLTYPKSLLEVVLVLEADDTLTRETIARTDLPDWMSVIEVPAAGNLTTKPRALNYALDFCRGSIIGVWDAEDWPEPDQIEKIVTRFAEAPPNVVCLQGVLDYYNARSNWLTRCFTIEYAIWWRVVMPGIARLGLVVPLGGTTLFFQRHVLEDLGGWDAHNVTEDADLGVRLARHGYKTELVSTVTREEATSRAWPWVRQRSRWLKGFLVTYFVHMRQPAALLRDLGLWRFIGIQALFLAAVAQFATAPVLWSFWVTFFGVTHPVAATLGDTAIWILAVFFLGTEGLALLLGLVALSRVGHRHLIPYVPTMMFYFTLGALAAYKALWELIRTPFFWDKTQHGLSSHQDVGPRPRS
ncbi:MAG: glycosyltransferase family 2 protein [Roseobacter sp.]|jgi:cellulose synthase/poly-beta-1,6-N-acetylglucosamine synthase-like glycosyltransferase|nr:glycosyltransferase family 2 protein [Roseobacter sp.]